MATNVLPVPREELSVKHYRPDNPEEAVEFDSFIAMLPQLRESHAGEYVAVRNGEVIASGVYLDPVLKLARSAAGVRPFYCGWVEPPGGYAFRMGAPTVREEGAP